jgi:hypothetical protein
VDSSDRIEYGIFRSFIEWLQYRQPNLLRYYSSKTNFWGSFPKQAALSLEIKK